MVEIALFGGGCFWVLEPAFAALQGVVLSQAGYSGGHVAYPRYEQVKKQNTGHVQVVQVRYKPNEIDFDTLLSAFFFLHDPTSINRQDPDIGSEYASIVFYTNQKQYQQTQLYIKKLELQLTKTIVTRVERGHVFWPAETEHYDYYTRNFLEPYSLDVIQPRLRRFSQEFKDYIPTLKHNKRFFEY